MLTTKILLNKVRQKKDGTYPLAIRITYNRKTTYLPLGYNLHEKDFDAKNQRIKPSNGITTNTTRINNQIQENLKKVYDTIIQLEQEGKIENLSMPNSKKRSRGKKLAERTFLNLPTRLLRSLKMPENMETPKYIRH